MVAKVCLSSINTGMQIYKITNKINNKWYIGKDASNRPYYFGSGIAIKAAISKYGKENFEKTILEECDSLEELNIREIYWITYTNAVENPNSYNIAKGGEGGDLLSNHPKKNEIYNKRGYRGDNCAAARKWFNSLSEEERKIWHKKQGDSRSKIWYVSRIETPHIEIKVKNINLWCKDNKLTSETLVATSNQNSHLYGKQHKGWRCRREEDLSYPSYVNKRKLGHENIACKGKSWKLVDGKRIWFDK